MLGEPSEPWVGLFSVLGVAAVVVAWYLVRGAGERARSAAAAFGAAVLALQFARLVGNGGVVGAILGGFGYPGDDPPRQVAHAVLLLAGLALGVAAVGYARRRADEAAEDLAADAADAAAEDAADDQAGLRDDPDEGPDPWVASRRRLVAFAPSVDVAALALALALPLAAASRYSGNVFGFGGEVTLASAFLYVVTGLTAAAALLALARRTDIDDRVVVGGAGLIAFAAVLLPIWPGTLSNEFWATFAGGLAAGLAAAVALPLLKDVIPVDRRLATAGALAAVALLAVTSWLTGLAWRQDTGVAHDFPQDVGELPDVILPTDLPGFPTELPTGFLPTGFPAP